MDDSLFSFSELAQLFPKKEKAKPKTGNFTSSKWLNGFTKWLENDYQTLVHHERAPGYHASQLFSVCPRKEVLQTIFKAKPEKLIAGQIATFDVGHALHWWWQHRYLGPKGELWGDWFCAGCKKTHQGFMPLNCECGAPWRESVSYQELTVVDEILGYTGHTDGILVDKDTGTRRIFEFKTCSDFEYKDLFSPKVSHIIQAHAYMRKLGPSETMIVYQNKGKQCEWDFTTGSPKPGPITIKPFIVKFDPELWKVIELRIHEDVKVREELKLLLESGTTPNTDDLPKYERICATRSDDAAKYCPFVSECFSFSCKTSTTLQIKKIRVEK